MHSWGSYFVHVPKYNCELKNAINLSAEFNITLRLLYYESEDAIRWRFSSMHVGIHRPISRIEKSSLLYENPRFFVKFKNVENLVSGENSIRPIRGIVFFVYASNQALKAPIKHRFKYLDPVNGAVLAQMIVGEVEIENELNFISIIRHSCDGDWCKIGGGGAFFR